MHKLQRYLLTASIAIAGLLPATALAQIVDSGNALPAGVSQRFGTFEKIIRSTFNITILVSGIVFVFLMLLGGVQYLTSLGEEDATIKARKIILNGAIGLVIVLTAFAIGTYVLQLLGFDNQSGTLNVTPPIR